MFYKFDFLYFSSHYFFSFMIDFEDPVSVSYIIITKFITVLKENYCQTPVVHSRYRNVF